MIRIKHLTKIYTGQRAAALENLTLEIPRGAVFGFLGPNGAGKTTTIKLLLGLLQPTSGAIEILNGGPQDLAVKKRIGFLPEQPYFYQYLTGWEFLEFCADIFALPKEKREKQIRAVLEKTGLAQEAWQQKIRTYSKGMEQRLGLAQALINDPELVILDEPMSGLDPLGRREICDLILDLRKEKKTVFFSSHILSDVELLCTHIAILDHGKLLLSGEVKGLKQGKKLSLGELFLATLAHARS